LKIEFIASTAVITDDPARSRKLYVDALGLPLDHGEGDEYYHSDGIAGSRHFGVWPLQQAAQACFGTDDWPSNRRIPQASIEFELADADAVSAAAKELAAQGFEMLHDARTEPWGQTVCRFLSDEGLVIGMSFAPWTHGA
jgi:catechol 2,3-dioxygenase-like lactoylglutathione lyase family enzyme